MTTRLEIINNALTSTGNNKCSVEFDGSPEWEVAFTAYNRGLGVLLEEHDWNFGTRTAPMARTGASTDPRYSDAYAMPADCLMLRGVFVRDVSQPITRYAIVDNQVICDFDGDVLALYTREPPSSSWPNLFVEVLTLYIEAGCFRGLNEDFTEARNTEAMAEARLQRARTRTDQQEPGRNLFRSRVKAARHRRRG